MNKTRLIAGVLAVVSLAVAALGLAGVTRIGGSGPGAPEPPGASEHRTTPERALIGTITVARAVARARPSRSARVVATFERRDSLGTPTVFLLLDSETRAGVRWYRALLPVRPNGTKGFLPATDLELSVTPYRIVIDRARFELTLYEGREKAATYPVGIGTGRTPTPVGRFYLTSLLQPPDPNTIYGTYAYGLSGFSETLTDWVDGGVIGLHGTNRPGSVGARASKGCIRMHNRDIEELVDVLPLGTPVRIL